MLMISIPVSYENGTLEIKSLKLSATGNSIKEALLLCAETTPFYTTLATSKIVKYTDFRKRDFIHLEMLFDDLVWKQIALVEPSFADKSTKSKQKIQSPTNEEVLKLGF